jgi:hypothetical protein
MNRFLTSLRVATAWACMAALAPFSLPAHAAVASGTLVPDDGAPVRLEESLGPDGRLERRFSRDGQLLYRSVVVPRAEGFEVEVLGGHPAQLGRFSVSRGQLEVRDAAGRPLWAEPLAQPLCLPELLAEFVRAHWAQLTAGAPPLRCVTPIIKARKVAPVQWQRLPDAADGSRVVELQPGSLGMRLFLRPTRLTFSADGARLLSQRGQFEAPPSVEGRARYLKGELRFEAPRSAADWGRARFATAAEWAASGPR